MYIYMFPVEVKISNAVKVIWGGVLGPLQSIVQVLLSHQLYTEH